MASGKKQLIQQEIDSWYPYRRGLRPEDWPHYDALCQAGKELVNDAFLKDRLLFSEGLFMAGALRRQRKIEQLKDQIADLEKQLSESGKNVRHVRDDQIIDESP